MDLTALLVLIAAKLGVPCTLESVRSTLERMPDGGCSPMTLDAGSKATKGLGAVLSALGVQDVDGATAKIAGMFKSVKALEDAMPELAAFYKSQTDQEDSNAEKEVEEVMTTRGFPEEARPALLFMRTAGAEKPVASGNAERDREAVIAFCRTRAAARAKFLERYPTVEGPPAHLQHLTQMLFAAPDQRSDARLLGGRQQMQVHSPLLRALDGTGRPAQPAAPPSGMVVNLDMIPGRNVVEKAKNWLLAQPGGRELSYDDLMAQASQIASQASAD